jgi:hypothetical protein
MATSPIGTLTQKDPRPGEALRHRAAHHRAGDQGQPRHPTEEPQGLPALLPRERRAQQRHRERHHQGGPGALDGARGDQPPRTARQRARRRRRDEHAQAGHKQAPAAEVVPERGARQQQHGEAEIVGVHRPLERLERGAEVATDRAQRGRDDQRV